MKNLPDPGTVIRYERMDDFTGERIEQLGTVLGEARCYIDATTQDENLCGIQYGEAVVVKRHNPSFQDAKDIVYDNFTVVKGPQSEIPHD